jgi:hypothetical protein
MIQSQGRSIKPLSAAKDFRDDFVQLKSFSGISVPRKANLKFLSIPETLVPGR